MNNELSVVTINHLAHGIMDILSFVVCAALTYNLYQTAITESGKEYFKSNEIKLFIGLIGMVIFCLMSIILAGSAVRHFVEAIAPLP